jgi:hypothetical protein
MSTALKQQEVDSSQEDFVTALLEENGSGIHSVPEGVSETSSTQLSTGQQPTPAAEGATDRRSLPATLVATTDIGTFALSLHNDVEFLKDGGMRTRFSDASGTLELDFQVPSNTRQGIINTKVRLAGQPLLEALRMTEFFDTLVSSPGTLSVVLSTTPPQHIDITNLPLSMPEPELLAHRDRLRLLLALKEIWDETRVEVRYPVDTEDKEGLFNLNLVLQAIRSGWVKQWVTGFNTAMPAAELHNLSAELKQKGEVLRAFLFDISSETYRVFASWVNLGPSRRYLASARLTTDLEEIEDWLAKTTDRRSVLNLQWEPLDDRPLHIFFDQWPKSSLRTVERDLRHLEAIYETDSDTFKHAWNERDAWARSLSDGKLWYSLIEAREELAQEA